MGVCQQSGRIYLVGCMERMKLENRIGRMANIIWESGLHVQGVDNAKMWAEKRVRMRTEAGGDEI